MAGFDNYRCDGQMSLFAFIEDDSWNPIEAYAHRGSGFSGGKERIKEYFSENSNINDRAVFLKKEYGTGGFGFASNERCTVHHGDSSASGIKIAYNDEAGNRMEKEVTYVELAEVISYMIEQGKY